MTKKELEKEILNIKHIYGCEGSEGISNYDIRLKVIAKSNDVVEFVDSNISSVVTTKDKVINLEQVKKVIVQLACTGELTMIFFDDKVDDFGSPVICYDVMTGKATVEA